MWAAGIIASFGILHWATGLTIRGQPSPFGAAMYYSGVAFFTIQMPDAQNTGSKIISVIEGGMGFSFLGLAISYIPTLYTNYSSRELAYVPVGCRGRLAALRLRFSCAARPSQ